MNRFSELYWKLDSTTKTNEKIGALQEYFARAEPQDAAWAIYFLTGNRIKQLIGTKYLRQWSTELSGVSDWLFAECYDRVGDLAETISLILPPASNQMDLPLHKLIEEKLIPIRGAELDIQKRDVIRLWQQFDQPQLFVLGKLMTGGFRVGVSRRLVTQALARHTGIPSTTIAHRMMGNWEPSGEFYESLTNEDSTETLASRPYPFFLANPLQNPPEHLGEASHWLAEWKWDGIRAQVIRRGGETFIWSRGEDLVTEQFPEIADAARGLPDGTVIDGEVLAWDSEAERPLQFSQLQRRLGRKRVGRKLLSEVPVILLAFDLLEHDGRDIRESSLDYRRERLGELIGALQAVPVHSNGGLFDEGPGCSVPIQLSPQIDGDNWQQLEQQRSRSKAMRAEGLMLKRCASAYQVNRPVGDWWKWKIDPYTIDAVLIYAQRGHGRRASLYTDYTFAVWKNDELVPFAKAYSGLTDDEIRRVDAFVRQNTHEKFGPVRSVTPELVFELAFENIQRSTRHKSGIAVRFPRISRWRHDKKPADADKLDTILKMLDSE